MNAAIDTFLHFILVIVFALSYLKPAAANPGDSVSDCPETIAKLSVYERLAKLKLLKIRKKPFPEKIGLLRKTFNPIELPLARHSEKITSQQYEPTLISDVLIVSQITGAALALAAWSLKDTAADPEKLQMQAADYGASVVYKDDLLRLIRQHPDYFKIRLLLSNNEITEEQALKMASDLAQEKKKRIKTLMELTEKAQSIDLNIYQEAFEFLTKAKENPKEAKFGLLSPEVQKIILRLKLVKENAESPILSYLAQKDLKQYLSTHDFQVADNTPLNLDLKNPATFKITDSLILEELKSQVWRELILDWLSSGDTKGQDEAINNLNSEFSKNAFLSEIKNKMKNGADPEKIKAAVDDWVLYKGFFQVWKQLLVSPLHPKTRKELTMDDFEKEIQNF